MAPDQQEVTDALDLVAKADDHLSAVEAAVQRLDKGEYGFCEICGQRLGDADLEADPARNRCDQHSSSGQHGGSGQQGELAHHRSPGEHSESAEHGEANGAT